MKYGRGTSHKEYRNTRTEQRLNCNAPSSGFETLYNCKNHKDYIDREIYTLKCLKKKYIFTKDTQTGNNHEFFYSLEEVHSLKEINSTILRTNFIGQSLHYKKKSLSDWITSSLKKDIKINVFKDILFNPITFKSLMPILEIIIKKKINGIYNLGSNIGLSKAMLAFKIAENLNKTSLINFCDSRDFFKVKRSH